MAVIGSDYAFAWEVVGGFQKTFEEGGGRSSRSCGCRWARWLLPSMGDEALGALSPLIYSGALDTPAHRRVVKEYRGKFGKVPSYFAETNYTSARWIYEAVKAVNGNVEDREALLAALRKVESGP